MWERRRDRHHRHGPSTTAPTLLGGASWRRQLHATRPQPLWYVGVGLGFAGLYVGTRYILRAQERLRRRREGLPEHDDDDDDGHDADGDDGYGRARARRRLDRVLGIDFGSTNLRLAVAPLFRQSPSTSLPQVLENADGLRAIPAAVAVDNGTVLVGSLARALLGRKTGHTALATRLLLGKSPKDTAAIAMFREPPYEIPTDQDAGIELALDGHRYSAEWAAEIQLDHLHDVAGRTIGPHEDADGEFPLVLAVPAAASDEERVTLERLAITAGFDLVSSVEEPVAAMRAIEHLARTGDVDEDFARAFAGPQSGPIAVFDMGGYVSTLTLLERHDGSYRVLDAASTTTISGAGVDQGLFRLVVERFRQEVGIDLSIDHMARYRVLEAVEAAKKELSTRQSTDLNLPFITADMTGAKHLVQRLTTVDLRRVLETPMAEALTLCDQGLKRAGLEKGDIGLLVVIGGGGRTEYVRSELERYFHRRAFTSREYRPEEAVVVGAAEWGRRLVEEGA